MWNCDVISRLVSFLSLLSHKVTSVRSDSSWAFTSGPLLWFLNSPDLSSTLKHLCFSFLQRFHLIRFWRTLVLSCWVRRRSFTVMSAMSSQPIRWGSSGCLGTWRWCQSPPGSPVPYRTSRLFFVCGLRRIGGFWPAEPCCWQRTETCGGPGGPASHCRSTVSSCKRLQDFTVKQLQCWPSFVINFVLTTWKWGEFRLVEWCSMYNVVQESRYTF